MTERHDIVQHDDGIYWCDTENVNANDCTDESRCETQCVCNSNGAQQLTALIDRTWPDLPRLLVDEDLRVLGGDKADAAVGVYLPNATAGAIYEVLVEVERLLHH